MLFRAERNEIVNQTFNEGNWLRLHFRLLVELKRPINNRMFMIVTAERHVSQKCPLDINEYNKEVNSAVSEEYVLKCLNNLKLTRLVLLKC